MFELSKDTRIRNELTTQKDSIKKAEVIREVSALSGHSQVDVRDILNAFVDIAQKEMITNGTFCYPGLMSVTLKTKPISKLIYYSHIDKTIAMPKEYILRATVPDIVRNAQKQAARIQMNKDNGVSADEWWKPYVYCEGKHSDCTKVVDSIKIKREEYLKKLREKKAKQKEGKKG